MFCIFILSYFESIRSNNRIPFVIAAPPCARSLSLSPPPSPLPLFHSSLSHSSLSIIITQLEIRTEQAGTIYDWSISSKGGGYDDAGGEEMVGKARGRSKLRQNCVGGRSEEQRRSSEWVRLQNSKRKRARRKQSAEIAECCFYLFLFFQSLLGSKWVIRLISSQL